MTEPQRTQLVHYINSKNRFRENWEREVEEFRKWKKDKQATAKARLY